MRILYVTAALPFGSAESFVIPEVEALCRRGHDVRVVPVRPRGPVVHGDAGRLVRRTLRAPLVSPEVARGAAAALARSPSGSWQAIAPALLDGSPRIRAKNVAVLPKALWLAEALRRLRVDHVHAHWASTPATVAMVASSIAGVPWSFTAHRWDIVEGNLLPAKAASASFVRTISAEGLRELRARAGGAGRTLVVHMGVDVPRRPRPRPPANGASLSVLVPAALVPVKGHAVLLRALALSPPCRPPLSVALAGDGPLRNDLRRLAAELGVADRVAFLGQLPHDALLAELDAGAYDVVALASVPTGGETEGIPVSLLEAMARRVPVLATEVGAVPELLHGGAGVLVAPGDAEALAGALHALAADDGRRRALAEAGRRRVEESFAVDAIADRLVRLFEESAEARAAP